MESNRFECIHRLPPSALEPIGPSSQNYPYAIYASLGKWLIWWYPICPYPYLARLWLYQLLLDHFTAYWIDYTKLSNYLRRSRENSRGIGDKLYETNTSGNRSKPFSGLPMYYHKVHSFTYQYQTGSPELTPTFFFAEWLWLVIKLTPNHTAALCPIQSCVLYDVYDM